MKVLMINTASSTVINFRKDLIKHIENRGHEVVAIVNDEKYKEEIEEMGVRIYVINANNRSKSIFSVFKYMKNIKTIVKKEKPDLVFTFQVKPNTFGVLASKKYCRNIVSMVEGLGDLYYKKSLVWRILRKISEFLYKKALKYVKKIFFLNEENQALFLNKNIVKKEKAVLINGIGINLDSFPFTKITNFDTFVLTCRMIASKGVFEYCEAAKKIKEMGYRYNFLLIGEESEITTEDLKKYIEPGIVQYLGFKKDVVGYLKNSTVFVLPSYGEGMPISILEAMSIGRAIITTNVTGCKETVIPRFNGLIVNAKDIDGLTTGMIEIMSNREKLIEYGKNSRSYAETKYDQKTINEQILDAIFDK